MSSVRNLLLVVCLAVAGGALTAACAVGGPDPELNPQPLPPGEDPARSPSNAGTEQTGGSSSSGRLGGADAAAAHDGGDGGKTDASPDGGGG